MVSLIESPHSTACRSKFVSDGSCGIPCGLAFLSSSISFLNTGILLFANGGLFPVRYAGSTNPSSSNLSVPLESRSPNIRGVGEISFEHHRSCTGPTSRLASGERRKREVLLILRPTRLFGGRGAPVPKAFGTTAGAPVRLSTHQGK